MRFAIADPPYLGRAERWYGPTGRGSGEGRHRAAAHPEASRWDRVESHIDLMHELLDFDGWALFTGPAALRRLLPATPYEVTVLAWDVSNAPPSGCRVLSSWEPVLVRIPPERRAYGTGLAVRSALRCAAPRIGFAGAKPPSVTRWVLDVLGYQPDDELVDLFPGSGSVRLAADQGVLL